MSRNESATLTERGGGDGGWKGQRGWLRGMRRGWDGDLSSCVFLRITRVLLMNCAVFGDGPLSRGQRPDPWGGENDLPYRHTRRACCPLCCSVALVVCVALTVVCRRHALRGQTRGQLERETSVSLPLQRGVHRAVIKGGPGVRLVLQKRSGPNPVLRVAGSDARRPPSPPPLDDPECRRRSSHAVHRLRARWVA